MWFLRWKSGQEPSKGIQRPALTAVTTYEELAALKKEYGIQAPLDIIGE